MKNIDFNFEEGTRLLQRLIQFDTTNPPGQEMACVQYIQELLEKEGFETELIGKTPDRPTLITRLKGKSGGDPLLLYGHVDVVTTKDQDWKYPPFSGQIAENCIWGRGALDMKGGVAMMITALINLKRANFQPAGDLVLVVLSDEEAGGEFGAEYLVTHHANLLKGIRYAIGEFGGFPIYIGGKKFYAIQVAEKQVCWMKGTIEGQGGHASFPMTGGVYAKLGDILQKLDANRLPFHLLPSVRKMFDIMANHLDKPYQEMIRDITNPEKMDSILAHMGPMGRMFDAIMHNTVNVTVVKGGKKTNVIPSHIQLEMDGRVLPGFTFEDIMSEIQDLVGDDLKLEILQYSQNEHQTDLGMFDFFAKILSDLDAEGIPIPLLLSASTDARHFSKIGIQTYGFIPMDLPEDFNLLQYVHAANERIPISSYHFGIRAIQTALMEYQG